MTFEHADWTESFWNWPAWMCPTCQKSTLEQVKDSLKRIETGESKRAKSEAGWDIDWTTFQFIVAFKCTGPRCAEIVTCCGEARTDMNLALGIEQSDTISQERYYPKFFYPSLRFFKIPPECPKHVTRHLCRAFALAWSDRSAAVNATRNALEALLNDRRVPRTKQKKSGGRSFSSLAERIRIYAKKYPGVDQYLEALRWLGNAGSHAHDGEPSKQDMLNGFEVFEHLIDEIYLKRASKIQKWSAEIVRRKGKPKPKPKKRLRSLTL